MRLAPFLLTYRHILLLCSRWCTDKQTQSLQPLHGSYPHEHKGLDDTDRALEEKI